MRKRLIFEAVMNTRSIAPVFALLLILAGAGRLLAQDRIAPNADETGRIYLGNGLTLVSFKPRLLTANAGVTEFLYSPTGQRIAYMAEHRQGGRTSDSSLAIVGVQSGDTHIYVTGTAQPPTSDSSLTPASIEIDGLNGWSDDSAYLAFSVAKPAGRGLLSQIEYVDLVSGTVESVPFPSEALTAMGQPAAQADSADQSPAPDAPQPGQLTFAGMMSAVWAPGENLLAFTTSASYSGVAATTHTLCVFDPSTDTARTLLVDTHRVRLDGWVEGRRLLYHVGKDGFVFDLANGKPEPEPAKAPSLARQPKAYFGGAGETSIAAENGQTIQASDDQQPVTAGSERYGNATAIWVARQGGPRQMQRLLVDVFRGPASLGWNPPSSSAVQFAPNGGFERQGNYQVAYLAQGDLKVADLSVRSSTLMERAMAGEKLPCDQERSLALENTKQVGLAILEYTQDNDEKLPAGDGFADSLAPYLPPDVPIDLPNSAAFQYHVPANLSLSAAEDPANTVLGEYDLPCAKVLLYMDGHVHVEDTEAGESADADATP